MEQRFLYRHDDSWNRSVDDATSIIGYRDYPVGSFDLVRMQLNGRHTGRPNRRNAMKYVVVRGSVEFEIDDVRFSADERDVVHVEAGHRRELTGDAEIMIITSPPFDPVDEVPPGDAATR